MKKKKLLLVALSLSAVSAFAAQERVVKFQNHVRVGYDDNIYQADDKDGSGFITEIINLSSTLNFSSRTDLVLYWEPEFRYRFDVDLEFVTYQNAYAALNHALSQRVFLKISDRLRYQDKEGQAAGAVSRKNQNYLENSLLGALDVTVDSLSQVNLGGGYDFRTWDDSDYGKGTANNDYTMVRLNATYVRELKPDTTKGVMGLGYNDLEYEGNRGGYQSVSVFGGVEQTFSPNLSGTARAGASFNEFDYVGGSDDSMSPYLKGGFRYSATEQTSVNGTLGYSLARSQIAAYNAQNQLSLGLGMTHDVTAKISVSSSLGYTFSSYESDSSSKSSDADSTFTTLSLRGSYQVNRNNFVEAGYQFSNRSSGDIEEFDRNLLDIGWRLRL